MLLMFFNPINNKMDIMRGRGVAIMVTILEDKECQSCVKLSMVTVLHFIKNIQ